MYLDKPTIQSVPSPPRPYAEKSRRPAPVPLPVGDLLGTRHILFDDERRVCRLRHYAEYTTGRSYWKQQAGLTPAGKKTRQH